MLIHAIQFARWKTALTQSCPLGSTSHTRSYSSFVTYRKALGTIYVYRSEPPLTTLFLKFSLATEQ